jgi:dipeptidyl aminopeptidase/acylaminoacyl peptidase
VASDGSGSFRDLVALDSAITPDWNEAGIVYQSAAGIEVTQDRDVAETRAVFQEDWDWDPDWQPGGGRILFQSKEGSHWEIWSVTPEGGGIFALTRPETTLVSQLPSNVAPAWSPDGQHVVYLSNRNAEEDAGPWRLWVMDAGGGNKRPLPINIPIDYGFNAEQVADWGR